MAPTDLYPIPGSHDRLSCHVLKGHLPITACDASLCLLTQERGGFTLGCRGIRERGIYF